MTEREKMLAGLLYDAADEELCALRTTARRLCQRLNTTDIADREERSRIVRELFGSTGDRAAVMPDFYCDYGKNIFVGDNFFMNYGCVILDVCEVHIGKNCLIAPQVGIYTACHPLDVNERLSGKENGAPVTIGDNCWIGGRAVINPGVTLGNNVVVASGAVVTKSFPDNVLIGGVPARVLKQLTPVSEE